MKPIEWLVIAIVLLVLVLLLLPAIQFPPDPSPRAFSRGNLKQLGIALHVHHEDVGHLPSGTLRDGDGNAVHGWMTALLPCIEQKPLFESIDLDRPWDDPANAEPMQTVVDFYRNRRIDSKHDARGYALTHYAANVFVVSAGDPMRFEEVTDGLANTLLGGEVNGDFVAWGDPLNFRDPSLGMNAVPHGFGAPWKGGGANMLLADGSVHWFSNDTDPAVLRALATPNGGEGDLHARGFE
jgi:prepilin-type processing-associated H-X9-DG protein